jgi:hypothetical protein
VSLLSLPLTAISQGNTQVPWSAFDMGFAQSVGSANTHVTSVVGQSFVGVSSEGNTDVASGFLTNGLFQGPTGVGVENAIPTEYALLQNYPNPFNPSTNIRYDVPSGERVTLTVYNLIGEVVARLVDAVKPPGEYTVRWNAGGVPSGVYFYRLQAGKFTQTKKLVLMK